MADIKNSFLATLSLAGKPLVLMQHKLEYLLTDKTLTPERRAELTDYLGREDIRKMITTADYGTVEPLELYFRRGSENYTIFIRDPISFRGNAFSMEYAARSLIAYSSDSPTRFHLRQGRRKVLLTDLIKDAAPIELFSHSKEVNIKAVLNTPVLEHFTDLPSRIDGKEAEFVLSIIERNVAPLRDEIQ
ncbi:hypothetical protein FQ192_24750 [Pseudomonas sp. ANT_J12]|jgi:hypothetical protein|uniref:hypothetical protein n=1 Tax=Pseudomonas sp. ANT_J12 TaxID=2597351 RepID=UPI0011F30A53|nr:hypothetical protein [Pseudomonas sp. ANT_J12]KAA0985912.1 hypothetical protein FQ192_24750 [Pseudomonas sp. ANT_J12]